jgi:hypothetical protein
LSPALCVGRVPVSNETLVREVFPLLPRLLSSAGIPRWDPMGRYSKFMVEHPIIQSLYRYLACVVLFSSLLACRGEVREDPPQSMGPAMERALLETLQVSTTLYPPLWSKDKLSPAAKSQLIRIAEWALTDLNIPNAKMEDATISGSIANFNYSSFSDVDLHIFINIDHVENPRMVEAYMRTYSTVWNAEHEITLFGLPVNIFVKNAHGTELSAGIYSVMKSQWIRKPKPMKLEVTREEVLAVTLPYADKIETALDNYEKNPGAAPCASYSGLRTDLRKFRKKHLEKDGELGVGNLAYKVLRRAGLINRLEQLFVRCTDATYSIEGSYTP